MSTYTTVKYEYEADGNSYHGYMPHPQEMARYWTAGDAVSVLYDPTHPDESCIVYR